MNLRLKFYYDFRTQTNAWYRNGIKNLKFTVCECKRKANDDGANVGIQCCPADFGTNDKSTNTDNVDLQQDIQPKSVESQEINGNEMEILDGVENGSELSPSENIIEMQPNLEPQNTLIESARTENDLPGKNYVF